MTLFHRIIKILYLCRTLPLCKQIGRQGPQKNHKRQCAKQPSPNLLAFEQTWHGAQHQPQRPKYIIECMLGIHSCWNFYKRFGDCLRWWLVSVFVTLHSAKYWMKAPKLVKTKKSQLKVPVTTAGRKMQFYRNSNRSVSIPYGMCK